MVRFELQFWLTCGGWHLKSKFNSFILGWSAGSFPQAPTVQAHPETSTEFICTILRFPCPAPSSMIPSHSLPFPVSGSIPWFLRTQRQRVLYQNIRILSTLHWAKSIGTENIHCIIYIFFYWKLLFRICPQAIAFSILSRVYSCY